MRAQLACVLLCVTLHAQSERIVSTSPSITETLFALGLGRKVVGVSTYCHYPPEATRLPKVGTYLKPTVEVIARLKPDLVIVQQLPNSVHPQIEALGIPVAQIDTGNFQQNLASIVAIGKAAGAEQAATGLAAHIRREIEALHRKARSLPVRSVVFIVGRTPGRLDGLIVVGGGSYLSELFETAGGRNIFADSSQAYLRTSLESIVRRNPDVLIDMGEMAETVGVTEAQKRAVVDLWRTQPRLAAVRANRVHAVASDIFVVPGPRMLDAARAFFAMLHPEASL